MKKDVKTIRWLNESPLWQMVKVPAIPDYNADRRPGFYRWQNVHTDWLEEKCNGNYTTTDSLVVPYKGRDKKALYEFDDSNGYRRFWFRNANLAMQFKLTFG